MHKNYTQCNRMQFGIDKLEQTRYTQAIIITFITSIVASKSPITRRLKYLHERFDLLYYTREKLLIINKRFQQKKLGQFSF